MLLTVLWVGDETANTAGFLFTPASHRILAEVCGALTVPSQQMKTYSVESAHIQVVIYLPWKKEQGEWKVSDWTTLSYAWISKYMS